MGKTEKPRSTQKPPAKKFVVKKRSAKKRGRPPSFKTEYIELAFNYSLLGATDKQLSVYFSVNELTINRWKKRHPEFCKAIKDAKEKADGEVTKSLFKRATGYIGKKTVTATDKGIVTDTKVVDDYVGPDTTACIFWLKNRQKETWRDRHDVGLSGHLALGEMSEDEIKQELTALVGGLSGGDGR